MSIARVNSYSLSDLLTQLVETFPHLHTNTHTHIHANKNVPLVAKGGKKGFKCPKQTDNAHNKW
jgi:hypothetical protein